MRDAQAKFRRARLGGASWAAFFLILLNIASLPARAEPPDLPTSTPESSRRAVKPRQFSDFEQRRLDEMLEAYQLTRLEESEAEGRTVELIIVSPEPVFTPEDAMPDFLNLFHKTSQDRVIRREILTPPGSVYRSKLALESERNLRDLHVFSLVLVIPVRGTTEDSVRILVLTKDLWSLRAATNFLSVGGVLKYFLIEGTEINLLGLNKKVGAYAYLELDTLTVGQFFTDDRINGSRIGLTQKAAILLNRMSGDPEGYSASASLQRPLLASTQRLGFGLNADTNRWIERSYVGSELRTFDNPATESVEALPYISRRKSDYISGMLERSQGELFKQNVGIGYSFSELQSIFGENTEQYQAFDPELVEAYSRDSLPADERSSGPFVQYTFFEGRYRTFRNLETFAIAEDFRFGPYAQVKTGRSLKALGSDSTFQWAESLLGYRFDLEPNRHSTEQQTDILSVRLFLRTRWQNQLFQDNEVSATVRNYFPVFLHGRAVTAISATWRSQNFRNRKSELGGDSLLRGYESGAFLGQSMISGHVEWRSLPHEVFGLQVGWIGFYDFGGVSDRDDWSDFKLYDSAGPGLRILNPALNTSVIRMDWGLPLNDETGSIFPGRITMGFEQAF